MKNLIDYAYQDNGTDFRKELYGAIHDKVAAAIENKKQEIAAGFMGQQEESYEDEGESLDEAKKPELQVYHPSYSSAVQHAEKHLNASGYEIHPDDWFHHVNSGPSKPAEGKTVSLHIPLHKNGIPSKKVAHIQVYNRGNDIANNHELNVYAN